MSAPTPARDAFAGGDSCGELFEHAYPDEPEDVVLIVIRGPDDAEEPIVLTVPGPLARARWAAEAAENKPSLETSE